MKTEAEEKEGERNAICLDVPTGKWKSCDMKPSNLPAERKEMTNTAILRFQKILKHS